MNTDKPEPMEHPAVAEFLRIWNTGDWDSPEVKLAFKRVPLSMQVILKMRLRKAYKNYRKERLNDLQQEQSANDARDKQG